MNGLRIGVAAGVATATILVGAILIGGTAAGVLQVGPGASVGVPVQSPTVSPAGDAGVIAPTVDPIQIPIIPASQDAPAAARQRVGAPSEPRPTPASAATSGIETPVATPPAAGPPPPGAPVPPAPADEVVAQEPAAPRPSEPAQSPADEPRDVDDDPRDRILRAQPGAEARAGQPAQAHEREREVEREHEHEHDRDD